MKRRNFIIGIGSLAAGSAAAISTGAFTSVEATREVSVTVAEEDEAYLALDPTDEDNATFVTQDNSAEEELSIDINDANGTVNNGNGVGLDSIYEFDNLFNVENQGTQQRDVSITTLSSTDFGPDVSGLTVHFYAGEWQGTSLDPNNGSPVTVGTGESATIGLRVTTTGETSTGDFDADATVTASSDGT